jgi:glycosyltransferase involved in cell wall biosynthesis
MNLSPSRGTEPRILFIAADLSTGGGVSKVIRDLALLFKRRLALDVSVVEARGGGATPSYSFEEVPVEQHRAKSLFAYFRLLVRLRRERPDFVISSWTQDNILVAHATPIRTLRRIVYPFAWRVVVLNRIDLEHYRGFLSNVRLIPNPVVPPTTETNAQREKLIIAVGHLEPLKQFDQAIRAMAASELEDLGWSLAVIGSGSSEAALSKLIGELGLERTRICAGAQDLGGWYARASLIMLTSRLESFSLVLAEAMLAGVVPIAYASDGPMFVLEGFPEQVVAMDDVDGLASRLIQFAEGDLEPLRQRLRQSIATRFAPEAIARQWRELLCR